MKRDDLDPARGVLFWGVISVILWIAVILTIVWRLGT